MTTLRKVALASFLATATAVAATSSAEAQGKTITLCWAAWDPANALVELSKDFTAKTGINMKFEFVPWPNFADRFLNELNSKGKLCDLMIGDSQWIGGSAENGHYVKLNDFFAKEGIKMSDFMPATVIGYSQWPKNTPNYWALPAMGDAVGWTYRKDWFAKPELQAEFKAKYKRELAPPKTWDELKQIAEFFQGREIDGKKVYGASIFTERGSEGITMGVTNALYPFGFKYQDPKKPYSMEGFVNSADAVEGLEVLQGALQVLHAAGLDQRLHAGRPRRLQVRPGGDADELVRLLPRPVQGPEGRAATRSASSSIRAQKTRPRSWAGRAFRWSLLAQPQRGAAVHQVVRAARRAEEMVVARRLFLPQGGAERSELPQERAVRGRLPDVDGDGVGFLGRAVLRAADARHAEARPRLRGRRQGHGEGGARSAGEGLDEDLQGRRQALKPASTVNARLPHNMLGAGASRQRTDRSACA